MIILICRSQGFDICFFRRYNKKKGRKVIPVIFSGQIEKIYRSKLYNRCDDVGVAHYFSAEDFPGLRCQSYAFPAHAGHTLQGWFYSYAKPIAGRLVVFDHGMGGGHRSYMREIERIARAGYLVFAYDHSGCMESGGENTNGFAQSLNDLDACLKALKQLDTLRGRTISVVGHSWGAFSTMNIAALHPEIAHVVAMSGFVSVKEMVNQNFSGLLKGYRKDLYALERKSNPEYVGYHACKSLAETNAQVLLIYSTDDPLVKKEVHYDALHSALSGKKNVKFLLLEGKGHNPNYTKKAVKLLAAYTKELTGKLKKLQLGTVEERKAFLQTFDWWAMTEQDESVWQVILETLAK